MLLGFWYNIYLLKWCYGRHIQIFSDLNSDFVLNPTGMSNFRDKRRPLSFFKGFNWKAKESRVAFPKYDIEENTHNLYQICQ